MGVENDAAIKEWRNPLQTCLPLAVIDTKFTTPVRLPFFAKINDVDSLREDDDYTAKKRKQLADDLTDSVDELKGGFLDSMYSKK